MNILLITQYYKPESVGAGIYLSQLAEGLVAGGHAVTVLTGFPNYPEGRVFEGYRGKLFQRETIDGVYIVRTWLYATTRKNFWMRAVSFFSFTVSSLLGGLFAIKRPDVIYTILQPLTLGPVSWAIGKKTRAPVVLNIQDIHPEAAVAVGALRNPQAIHFLDWLEKWNYCHTEHTIVISESFRGNLMAKGVPAAKISVVPNWADPDFIQPGPKENEFRRSVGVGTEFLLVYSGTLSHNSNLEPVIGAADILRDEPFRFVIVGEGVRKDDLISMAEARRLSNIKFLPFQPLETYPDVLRAADINLVTLSHQAASVSVPSKIYKQMAAGRPVLAITAEDNELGRMIKTADCGLLVPPDNPRALADALCKAAAHPDELVRMGQNARTYLEQEHSKERCVDQIEKVLECVAKRKSAVSS
jgi:colanic acid biosynthesis glycosyl transferase WcaI